MEELTMENTYRASIIDMDVKTENRGTTARMFFTINIMPDIDDRKIDRAALTKKISNVTAEVTHAIVRSNSSDSTEKVMVIGDKEFYCKDGKLFPRE